MKKYGFISAIGFLLLFFSATASDAGTDLSYTVAPAIIGAFALCYGLSNVCRAERAARIKVEKIHKNRAEYRAGWRRQNVVNRK